MRVEYKSQAQKVNFCDCHYGDNKRAQLDTFVYFDAKHKILQIGILSAGKYIYIWLELC